MISLWNHLDALVERAVLRTLSPTQERLLMAGVGLLTGLSWLMAWKVPGTAAQALFFQLAVLTFFFGLRRGLIWALPTWAGYAYLVAGTLERVCFAFFCLYGLLIAGVTVGRFRQARRGEIQLFSGLELARQVQLALQPQPLVDWGFARMESSILTARQLGGDLVCWRSTERGVIVLVGDVMGKGPQAALTAAYVKGAFDALAEASPGVEQLLLSLHQQLQQTRTESFLAALCVEIERAGGWTICRAGLPSPCLVRADGEVVHVPEAGIMLGIPVEPHLRVSHLERLPGDRLFIASDGLCEEEELPRELLLVLREGASLARCIQMLRKRGTAAAEDDQTAVLLTT